MSRVVGELEKVRLALEAGSRSEAECGVSFCTGVKHRAAEALASLPALIERVAEMDAQRDRFIERYLKECDDHAETKASFSGRAAMPIKSIVAIQSPRMVEKCAFGARAARTKEGDAK